MLGFQPAYFWLLACVYASEVLQNRRADPMDSERSPTGRVVLGRIPPAELRRARECETPSSTGSVWLRETRNVFHGGVTSACLVVDSSVPVQRRGVLRLSSFGKVV
jgi:hypothetical protein